MAMRHRSPQVGISLGYTAGLPAIQAEARFHDVFDMVRTSFRIGATYAQGEDTDKVMRKHALLAVDGMYRLNPPQAQGFRSYVGGGLNYDVYTTGQKSGAMGYQLFYGVEAGPANNGQTFFELGYGTIKTGFSPDNTGLMAMIGYKF